MNMLELYERLSEPVMVGVMRDVRSMMRASDLLKNETLASGAMPGEFTVVLRFRQNRNGWPGMAMMPELA